VRARIIKFFYDKNTSHTMFLGEIRIFRYIQFSMSVGALFCLLYWWICQGDITSMLTLKFFLMVGFISLVEHEMKKQRST